MYLALPFVIASNMENSAETAEMTKESVST